MAIIKNKTKHKVRFVAYRADGEYMHQDSGEISPDESRFVKGDYLGDIDWFVIAAFIPESKTPHHFSINAPYSGKEADPLAFARVGRDEKFVLVEDDVKKEYKLYLDQEEPEGALHGW